MINDFIIETENREIELDMLTELYSCYPVIQSTMHENKIKEISAKKYVNNLIYNALLSSDLKCDVHKICREYLLLLDSPGFKHEKQALLELWSWVSLKEECVELDDEYSISLWTDTIC